MLERQMTADAGRYAGHTRVRQQRREDRFVERSTTTKRPRKPWIGVGTGFLGMNHAVVPLAGATMSPDGVSVRYSKEQVKDAPEIDSTRAESLSRPSGTSTAITGWRNSTSTFLQGGKTRAMRASFGTASTKQP